MEKSKRCQGSDQAFPRVPSRQPQDLNALLFLRQTAMCLHNLVFSPLHIMA